MIYLKSSTQWFILESRFNLAYIELENSTKKGVEVNEMPNQSQIE